MTGADVVYKDVVEPLESVSVTITPTDKKDITEFGDIADVSVVCVLGVGWSSSWGSGQQQQQQLGQRHQQSRDGSWGS